MDPYLIPHTKISSKCIIDLNVRLKTIKLLTESIGEKLHDMRLGNYFLNIIPKAKTTKAELDNRTTST